MAIAKASSTLFSRAIKLLAADPRASRWKIKVTAEKLTPAERVILFRALAAHPQADVAEARDDLALALAKAGVFDEAILIARTSVHARFRLYEIGEIALDAEAYDSAECAFDAIREREKDVLAFIGLAIAQKNLGKADAMSASIAKAWTLNESEEQQREPMNWEIAASCHERLHAEMCRAMIMALEDDKPAAKKHLFVARKTFEQSVRHAGVRTECVAFMSDDNLSRARLGCGRADMIRLSGLD